MVMLEPVHSCALFGKFLTLRVSHQPIDCELLIPNAKALHVIGRMEFKQCEEQDNDNNNNINNKNNNNPCSKIMVMLLLCTQGVYNLFLPSLR